MKKVKVNYATKVPKGAVLFTFVKGNTVRFIEKNNTQILEVGFGKSLNTVDRRQFIKLVRNVIRQAKAHNITHLAREESFYEFKKLQDIDYDEIAQLFAENVEIANYDYTVHKSKKDDVGVIEKITLLGNISTATKRGIKKGQTVGEYVNKCRTLANTPGGEMTPTLLAKEAQKIVKGTGATIKVLNEAQIKKLKMGALLGVAQGSDEEPKLIVIEHKGKSKNLRDPLVLVGKGVTFDSGGLNIKTGSHMLDMHLDMSGGASVIAAVALAAKLGVKKNIVGVIPAVENMPSGASFRPGDVLKSMSGKTIDVLNTDAEGRLILADGITYAKKFYKPKLLVDVATLTGAALAAVGERANIIMTPDRKLQDMCMDLGEASGDYVWPLPCWDEYNEDIKGRFGDIANLGSRPYGGTIAAGMFLKAFAEKTPWVHIDMAPRMVSIQSDNLATGATGEPVRFFSRLFDAF